MTWAEFWEHASRISGLVAMVAMPVFAAYMTRRGNVETKREEGVAAKEVAEIEATAAPYESMVEYVSDLTAEVKGLRAEVATLRKHDEERERDWWIDRRYILDIHQYHPAWPQWRPGWVAAMYAPDGTPTHPPTPGSVIEPHQRKE